MCPKKLQAASRTLGVWLSLVLMLLVGQPRSSGDETERQRPKKSEQIQGDKSGGQKKNRPAPDAKGNEQADAVPRKEKKKRPQPELQDVSYGPHERNVLDLWKAKSSDSTPIVVFFHGGGFMRGDKTDIDTYLIQLCLDAGISVASVNYRLSDEATFPAPMRDASRAIQFLRSKAKEWNLDPDRVAASGVSAGGVIALWLGFHEDLANPDSSDPVARQSTRPSCMGVFNTPVSLDPWWAAQEIAGTPERPLMHEALLKLFGLEETELDTPRAHALYKAASPIDHLSADDPPAFLYYSGSVELPRKLSSKKIVHHARHGTKLKQQLDSLGIECVLRTAENYTFESPYDRLDQGERELIDFLRRQFRMSPRSELSVVSPAR